MGVGAFNLIRASAYRAMGGHQPVALRPDDDLKFGKLVKDHGYRQDVLNGRGMVTVEWYRSVGELIDGLMKNMFAGMEYSVSLVIAATLAALLMHIWPWIGVWMADGWPQALYAVTVVMMIGSFGVAMAPFGVKFWQGLILPLHDRPVGLYPMPCGMALGALARRHRLARHLLRITATEKRE